MTLLRWAAVVAGAWLVAVVGLVVWAHRRPPRRVDLGPRPPRSRTVRADDGVALHVEEDGDPDAPLTVVFVHGFTARLGEYALQREALGHRARIVLYDHRGHGRSGWGDYDRGTIEQLARDLESVLDEVVPRGPVVLVGHSLGGMVVMTLARQRPELFGPRVVGAFLLATSAAEVVSTGPLGAWVRLLDKVGLLEPSLPLIRLWLRIWGPVVELVRTPGSRLGRAWIRYFLFGREDADPDVVTLVQDMLEEAPFRISAAFYASFVAHDELDSLAALRKVPVGVLVGSDDRLTPPRASRRIAAAIGDSAELVVVPGAGHSVNITRRETVDDALHRLLDRAEAHAGVAGTGRRSAGLS